MIRDTVSLAWVLCLLLNMESSIGFDVLLSDPASGVAGSGIRGVGPERTDRTAPAVLT
jgi:hypothetical protein